MANFRKSSIGTRELELRSARAAAAPARVAAPQTRLPALLRWAFLLFVFTIPIESLNRSLNLGPISLSRFAGLGLFGVTFIYFKRCYSALPGALWCFLLYLAVYVTTGSFIASIYAPFFNTQLYSLIQLVVFFWFA